MEFDTTINERSPCLREGRSIGLTELSKEKVLCSTSPPVWYETRLHEIREVEQQGRSINGDPSPVGILF